MHITNSCKNKGHARNAFHIVIFRNDCQQNAGQSLGVDFVLLYKLVNPLPLKSVYFQRKVRI